jgi:hypothetical protein
MLLHEHHTAELRAVLFQIIGAQKSKSARQKLKNPDIEAT